MSEEVYHCYRVLELEQGASLEQLKQARRELAKVWHPDRFQNDEKLQHKAQERLKEINGAYEILEKYLTSGTPPPPPPPMSTPMPEQGQGHERSTVTVPNQQTPIEVWAPKSGTGLGLAVMCG